MTGLSSNQQLAAAERHAYEVNVDGLGRRFEPAIHFDAEDADAEVADCMFLERVAAKQRGELDSNAALEPTPDEVSARRNDLVSNAPRETSSIVDR